MQQQHKTEIIIILIFVSSDVRTLCEYATCIYFLGFYFANEFLYLCLKAKIFAISLYSYK